MDQLFSAFGIDWRLLIAQAINFALVLVALRYFLYTPVMDMLAKRKALVAQGVADAEKAGALLAGADHEAAERVRTADTKAQELLARAREAAAAEKGRLLKEAEERAAALTREAALRTEEAAARGKRESEREIARVALLAAEKILKKHYD
ncbi:MAG: ATP synthase F0 subunit B [Patescibacteria group bacterium]